MCDGISLWFLHTLGFCCQPFRRNKNLSPDSWTCPAAGGTWGTSGARTGHRLGTPREGVSILCSRCLSSLSLQSGQKLQACRPSLSHPFGQQLWPWENLGTGLVTFPAPPSHPTSVLINLSGPQAPHLENEVWCFGDLF